MIPHSRIRNALRKLWSWSPERRAALKRAKWNDTKLYRCESCHLPTAKPQVDHVVAVGRTPGAKGSTATDTWQLLIERLFCESSGLRVLCAGCHAVVTKREKVDMSNIARYSSKRSSS